MKLATAALHSPGGKTLRACGQVEVLIPKSHELSAPEKSRVFKRASIDVAKLKPDDTVVISALGPQSFFGEMALLNQRGASVATVRVKVQSHTRCIPTTYRRVSAVKPYIHSLASFPRVIEARPS